MYNDRLENAQRVLRARAGYTGAIDGDPGPQSLAAAARVAGARPRAARWWPPERHVIAAAQLVLAAEGFDPGPIDGLYGVRADGAYLEWRARGMGVGFPDRDQESDFGRQADVVARFGAAGSAACTAGKIRPPWRMVLAWDTRAQISEFRCHVDVADAGQRALEHIAATHSALQIRELGLHLFGGCYNYRKKRGGSTLSMHAWGVAIDLDPARNRLPWNADRARLARTDAGGVWAAFESEGWLSLGRARNYDWMHVQAPRL